MEVTPGPFSVAVARGDHVPLHARGHPHCSGRPSIHRATHVRRFPGSVSYTCRERGARSLTSRRTGWLVYGVCYQCRALASRANVRRPARSNTQPIPKGAAVFQHLHSCTPKEPVKLHTSLHVFKLTSKKLQKFKYLQKIDFLIYKFIIYLQKSWILIQLMYENVLRNLIVKVSLRCENYTIRLCQKRLDLISFKQIHFAVLM